jgi:hypothetical protein
MGHSLQVRPRPLVHKCPLCINTDRKFWALGLSRCANSGCEQSQQGSPYSITSSARASSVGGTVRPSALAVLRLIKSSMLVGNSTGRSPGLAPFQLKNAPLWALGFICPRVHVSALSDRLGSELGVGYLHHRQRPCARRRWLRDPSRSRL